MRPAHQLITVILGALYLATPATAQVAADSPSETRAYTAKEVDRKANVTSREQPPYTIDARKNDVTGQVTLRVLPHSSGKVTSIVPIKRLPDGLTEKAIEAAKRIKFVPAMKDGRAVSQYITINYNFDIYYREDDPEITRKAVILEQPAAVYTDEARARMIEGTVVLEVSLDSDGEARVMRVVRGLPHGLTERAMAAAQNIKFTPAARGERPTTVAREVTYEFRLK